MTHPPAVDKFVFDEAEFKSKVAHTLVATNLKGAYTTPAPPDDFDPNTATAEELAKYGAYWGAKPSAKADPGLVKTWNKVFGHKWSAKNRIIPQMEPQVGKSHNLKKPLHKASNTHYTGTQWAGAGFISSGWTGCVGFWVIPTVSKPSEPQGSQGGWDSSSWIGLDGWFYSNDVLQAGIQQTVNAQGQANYVAWYEWIAPQVANSPGYIWQTNIPNFPVSPGQQVYCSIQYTNNKTAGYIYFANETTGHYFSITLAPPPGANFNGQSVEWIMEAPNGGEGNVALPKFTPITFTDAIACGASTGNPLNGSTADIETTGGKLLTSTTTGNNTVTIDFIG